MRGPGSSVPERIADHGRQAGEPPLPQRPDTRLLDELRVKAGNEQLLALYEYRGQLSSAIDEWKATAEAIQQRLPLWNTLRRLTAHARDLSDAQPLLERVDLIEEQRQLLGEADPLMPLVQDLTQLLRDKLNGLNSLYMAKLDEGLKQLSRDGNWQKLDEVDRKRLLAQHQLDETARPVVRGLGRGSA